MKKILFYVENNWSFGRIHNDLIKVLYPEGIYCDIIDWRISYSYADFNHFLRTYDYIVTTIHGSHTLYSSYKVPLSKIGAVAHSNLDLQEILFRYNLGSDYFNQLKSYGVISEYIKQKSFGHRIERTPHIVNVGCFNDLNIKNSSTELRTVGYVGHIHRAFYEENTDIKRGNLVIKSANNAGLSFVHYQDLHFLCSKSMYKDFDILMFASTTEGLPTVAIEAICCGVPVLGTETGIFPDISQSGAGVILPMDEDNYVLKATEILNELKNDSQKYQHMVKCAFEESKKHDWSVAKQSWIQFINSLYLK